MSQMFIGKLITAAVSVVFAVWDIRFRKIPLPFYGVTFLLGAVFAVCAGRQLTEVLLSALPGVLLLLLSAVTEGGIGMGDGLFFLAAAGFLSPRDCVLSVILAVLFASLAAFFLYVVKRDRKAELPFLSLVPPALVLLLAGGVC